MFRGPPKFKMGGLSLPSGALSSHIGIGCGPRWALLAADGMRHKRSLFSFGGCVLRPSECSLDADIYENVYIHVVI